MHTKSNIYLWGIPFLGFISNEIDTNMLPFYRFTFVGSNCPCHSYTFCIIIVRFLNLNLMLPCSTLVPLVTKSMGVSVTLKLMVGLPLQGKTNKIMPQANAYGSIVTLRMSQQMIYPNQIPSQDILLLLT